MGILPSSDSDVTAALAAIKARNEATRPSSTKSVVPLGLLNEANRKKGSIQSKKQKVSSTKGSNDGFVPTPTKKKNFTEKESPSQGFVKSLFASRASSSKLNEEFQNNIDDHRDVVDSSSDEDDVEVDPATLDSLSSYLNNLNKNQSIVNPKKSVESVSALSVLSSDDEAINIDPATMDSVGKYIDTVKGNSVRRETGSATTASSRSTSPRKINLNVKGKKNSDIVSHGSISSDEDAPISNDAKAEIGAFIDGLNKKPQVNDSDSSSVETEDKSEESIDVGPETEKQLRTYISSNYPEEEPLNDFVPPENKDQDVLLLERVSKSVSSDSDEPKNIITDSEQEALKAYERHAQLLNSKLKNATSGDSRFTTLSSATLNSPQLSPTMGRSVDSSPQHSRSPSRSPYKSPPRSPRRVRVDDVEFMRDDLSLTPSGFDQVDDVNFDDMPEGASSNELIMLNYYIGKAVQLSNKENLTSEDVTKVIERAAQDGIEREMIDDIFEGLVEKPAIEEVENTLEKVYNEAMSNEDDQTVLIERAKALGFMKDPSIKELGSILLDARKRRTAIIPIIDAFEETYQDIYGNARAPSPTKSLSVEVDESQPTDLKGQEFVDVKVMRLIYYVRAVLREDGDTDEVTSLMDKANEEGLDMELLRGIVSDQDGICDELSGEHKMDLIIFVKKATALGREGGSSENEIRALLNEAKKKNLPLHDIKESFIVEKKKLIKAVSKDLASRTISGDDSGMELNESFSDDSTEIKEKEKFNQMELFDQTEDIEAFLNKFHELKMGGHFPQGNIAGLENVVNDKQRDEDAVEIDLVHGFVKKEHVSETQELNEEEKLWNDSNEKDLYSKYSDFLNNLPVKGSSDDDNDSTTDKEHNHVAECHDTKDGDAEVYLMEGSTVEVATVSSSRPEESRDSSPGRRMFPTGYGLSKDSEYKHSEASKADSGHIFYEEKFIRPGFNIDPRDLPSLYKTNSSESDIGKSDSILGRERPMINGVDAAISMQKRRESRALQRSPYKRTKQVWELSASDRKSGHPGYHSIDIKSIHLTTHTIRKHHLDKVPWEHREVQQHFLKRKSFPDWFGVIITRKQSRKIHLPISHPKSVLMQISNPPDPNTWEEEWYTTWKTRRDNPNTLKRRELENSSRNDGIDDFQSVVTNQRRISESTSTRGQLADLDSCIGAVVLSLPEIGTINTLRFRTGERVSRVHHEHTSFLRKSRWKKKYFPRGIFSN